MTEQGKKEKESRNLNPGLTAWVISFCNVLPGDSVRSRDIMLENSSIMLVSVTQKNLVLCLKLCSKNIALCSPDFYCIQHVLVTTV